MPEMTFTVRWPEGAPVGYYSPSLVVHDFLTAGTQYTVGDFVHRSVTALDHATERVRAKFGFACTSARATAEQIRCTAEAFPADAMVEVVALEPPLPEKVLP
ncbi:MSMEG_0570 family nitrogen starvation response protein [Nocardia miyunensis]|uniref:MSMEG_0570 family nitrogen starvation response protein n=1 Tax=Nocardia miyunensis TaxID=282684 RepID=UPI000829CBA0|nr:MSMEG_0570 family nitrogen starvation response protein [Nocardia miyunensis]